MSIAVITQTTSYQQQQQYQPQHNRRYAYSRKRSLQRQSFTQSLRTIPEDNTIAFMRQAFADAEDLDQESFHLIQQARDSKNLPALRRIDSLNELARQHAKVMAQQATVKHSVQTIEELQQSLHSRTVGENIHRGKYVTDMHAEIMKQPPKGSVNMLNLMSAKFDEIGTGTVMGEDGLLYSVQLFRRSAE